MKQVSPTLARSVARRQYQLPFVCLILYTYLFLSAGCGSPVVNPGAANLISTARERVLPKADSAERLWRPDLAIMPFIEFQDEDILIKHVRNCRYRTETDYDVRHYDLYFALDDVRTLDFIIVPFNNNPLLAHTMFSFGLVDGRHFIVSVEARLDQMVPDPKHDTYSARPFTKPSTGDTTWVA
jgi:hypothetical protein